MSKRSMLSVLKDHVKCEQISKRRLNNNYMFRTMSFKSANGISLFVESICSQLKCMDINFKIIDSGHSMGEKGGSGRVANFQHYFLEIEIIE